MHSWAGLVIFMAKWAVTKRCEGLACAGNQRPEQETTEGTHTQVVRSRCRTKGPGAVHPWADVSWCLPSWSGRLNQADSAVKGCGVRCIMWKCIDRGQQRQHKSPCSVVQDKSTQIARESECIKRNNNPYSTAVSCSTANMHHAQDRTLSKDQHMTKTVPGPIIQQPAPCTGDKPKPPCTHVEHLDPA